MAAIKFEELEAVKKEVHDNAVGWVRDVVNRKKPLKPEKLEAYEAGLEQGMVRLVSRLRELGFEIVRKGY